MEEKQPPERLS